MKKLMIKVFCLSLLVLGFIHSTINAQVEVDLSKYANHNLSLLEREADVLYFQKSYAKAAKLYLSIADQNKDYGDIYYKLSRCYAYLKKPAMAADFLVIAINNGFINYRLVKEDAAFDGIRENVHFERTYNEVLNHGKITSGQIYYVDVEKKIKCRVFFPDDYDANKSYPLLIGLHGYGSNTEDFAGLWTAVKKKSFIFVIPEAPYPVRIVGVRFPKYSWSMQTRNTQLIDESDSSTLLYIQSVAKQMKQEFKVSKTILMGFSQGTAFTYGAGLTYADEFDGLMCFAGRLPDLKKYPNFIKEEDLKNNNHLKIYISHGKNDRLDVKNSKNAAKLLKKYNYTVFLEVTESEHYITPDAFKNALNWHGI